jgi:hypothetical protein
MSWFRKPRPPPADLENDVSPRVSQEQQQPHSISLHHPPPAPLPPTLRLSPSEGSLARQQLSYVYPAYPLSPAPHEMMQIGFSSPEQQLAEQQMVQWALQESANEFAAKQHEATAGLGLRKQNSERSSQSISKASISEACAYQYWSQGRIGSNDTVVDGFYDLFGDFPGQW